MNRRGQERAQREERMGDSAWRGNSRRMTVGV